MTTTAANTWCSRHGDFREYHHQFDGITLTEFDVDTMKLKPETARTIWDGTSVKITEGPHLYKKDGLVLPVRRRRRHGV